MHITREFNSNEKSLSEKMKEIIIMNLNYCNIYETELVSHIITPTRYNAFLNNTQNASHFGGIIKFSK